VVIDFISFLVLKKQGVILDPLPMTKEAIKELHPSSVILGFVY